MCEGVREYRIEFPVHPLFVPVDLSTQDFRYEDFTAGRIHIDRTIILDGER